MSQKALETLKAEMLNGVDVNRLSGTIDAVQENPDIAKFRFRASNKWVNGGHNHTSIKDFYGALENHFHMEAFELDADEPPLLLGEDQGPNPVEYLLTALAGCLTSSLVYHAAARGIELRGVESRLEGDLNLRGFLGVSKDVKVGYENIRVYFKIDADVSRDAKEELLRTAQKYSPVFNTISNPTDVSVKLDLEKV